MLLLLLFPPFRPPLLPTHARMERVVRPKKRRKKRKKKMSWQQQ
jgi:hypothetical protein